MDSAVHRCPIQSAKGGFELVEALQRSAREHLSLYPVSVSVGQSVLR